MHLHGLLCEVGTGEWGAEIPMGTEEEEWRLPAEQRNKLLGKLDGPADTKLVTHHKGSAEVNGRRTWLGWKWPTGGTIGLLATTACLLLCFLSLPATWNLQQAKKWAREPAAYMDRYGMAATDHETMSTAPLKNSNGQNAIVERSAVTWSVPKPDAMEPIVPLAESSTISSMESKIGQAPGSARGRFGDVAQDGRDQGIDGMGGGGGGGRVGKEANSLYLFDSSLESVRKQAIQTTPDFGKDVTRHDSRFYSDVPSPGSPQIPKQLDNITMLPSKDRTWEGNRMVESIGAHSALSFNSPSIPTDERAILQDSPEFALDFSAEGNGREPGLPSDVNLDGRKSNQRNRWMEDSFTFQGMVERDAAETLGVNVGEMEQRLSELTVGGKANAVTVEETLELKEDKVRQSDTEAKMPFAAGSEGFFEKAEAPAIAGRLPVRNSEAAQTPSDDFRKVESDKEFEPFSKKRSKGRLALPEGESKPLEADKKEIVREKNKVAIDEQLAGTDPFSTFSLHVSDVSFKLAQSSLNQGQWPDASTLRIEEFINAMDYFDPIPGGDEKVACRVEQAIHPFLMQRNLLRVSMRTGAKGRTASMPLRLTILLDNSGSMERSDRRQLVKQAFETLVQLLQPTDQVTLISFANTPRLIADKVPGNQGESLLQRVESLPSEGGTNIEAALRLAREKALEQRLAGAQNRVVLLTDGAVNLGDAEPESLAKLVIQLRDEGIAFDAAGISAQQLNDEVLEALTRRGDGRYYLLDSLETIREDFANQLAGALRPSAKNVKVQIEFNPERVGRYRLLGFDQHRLQREDFRNDKVDAAELSAAEAGVALYQVEVKPNGRGDIGFVSVRFQDVATEQMVEQRWLIPFETHVPRLEQGPASMQLATTAALLAVKLGGGPMADLVDLKELMRWTSALPDRFAQQSRVQQLRTMIGQAQQLR